MMIQGKQYMSEFEARKAILDIGQRMYTRGYVAANDGNISCKIGPDRYITTPTGVSKGFMRQDMLLKVDGAGNVIGGKGKPSSELKMHMRVYSENPEVMAVTHAHPPAATSYAIAGVPLDRPILPEGVVQLGTVPVAHYATPGTTEVPDSIAPYCTTHNGVLLANHGALTWGADLYQAYYRLESMEYYALVSMYTGNILGKANELSCGQVDELVKIRSSMGIQTGGVPPCALEERNTSDVVSSGPTMMDPAAAPAIAGANEILERQLRPAGAPQTGCGCSTAPRAAGNTLGDGEREALKKEIMAEVVDRVVAKMAR